MEQFETRRSSAFRLDTVPVEITFTCPHAGRKACSQNCRFRFGISMATFLTTYRGTLHWTLSVLGGRETSGKWDCIADNTDVFVEHVGPCSGKAVLRLENSGGLIALWLTSGDGPEVKVNGRIVGRACYSMDCSGDSDKAFEVDTNHTSLKIAGLVRTLNIHGGVRRYLELGNSLVMGGHKFTLFASTSQEKKPWLSFVGEQKEYEKWEGETSDIVFTGACECFRDLMAAKANKKVVLVVAKFYADRYRMLWRKYGRELKWIGVATGWNKGMEEIEGVCIPGGVNTKFFRPVFPTGRKRLKVAFYARLGDGRGVERITNLAKSLTDCADFVGFDASGYPFTNGCGLRNISIVQTNSQEELRSVLQSSDVVVSCMRSAGWNNVIAEGAACGCVPVANDAGTLDVILHARTGYLCSTSKFELEAAEYIRYLASRHDVLHRMAVRASAWVQQFDWDIVAEKFLQEVCS